MLPRVCRSRFLTSRNCLPKIIFSTAIIFVFFYIDRKSGTTPETKCRCNTKSTQTPETKFNTRPTLRTLETKFNKRATQQKFTIHTNLTLAEFIVDYSKNSKQDIIIQNERLAVAGFPHQICGCGKYEPPIRTEFQRNLKAYNSTCSHEATEYGTGQKVRSYSLFVHEAEDIPRYILPIETNMDEHAKLFSGWITRIYSNISSENPIICGLVCKYDTLFWCDINNIPEFGNLSKMHGRTWRFLPLGDPTVDIFLSRDMDNTLFERERAAVAEWEASDLPFHSMRDNPAMDRAIQAGLWGVKNIMLGPLFSEFLQTKLIKAAKTNNFHRRWDEDILKMYIYVPYSSLLFLAHDSYTCQKFKDFKTLPFPTKRFEDQTVGEPYVKNVTKWKSRVPPCPVQCRPDYGKDWKFC